MKLHVDRVDLCFVIIKWCVVLSAVLNAVVKREIMRSEEYYRRIVVMEKKCC